MVFVALLLFAACTTAVGGDDVHALSPEDPERAAGTGKVKALINHYEALFKRGAGGGLQGGTTKEDDGAGTEHGGSEATDPGADEIQMKEPGENPDDDGPATSGGGLEGLTGGSLDPIQELDRDLEGMNTAHSYDDEAKKEFASLDLMDASQVEELGRYPGDAAKCMFRCIHMAHMYFSDGGSARRACECTRSGGEHGCGECQYLADDKVKDKEGAAIEVEDPLRGHHLSDKHFQSKSSQGRCVPLGEAPDAVSINFRGTIVQC